MDETCRGCGVNFAEYRREYGISLRPSLLEGTGQMCWFCEDEARSPEERAKIEALLNAPID